MTAAQFAIDTDALHAYADGQLSGEQRAAVVAYLAAHPDAAALVANWQRQNEALSALFAPAANEPVPARLSPHGIAIQARRERGLWLRGAVAAALILAVSGSAGWYLRGALWTEEPAADRLVDQALVAHALYIKEKTHAVEVAADAPNLMAWLSNRISTPIDAPNLTEQGFTFLGGRLLPGYDAQANGPAAQLMYQNAAAQRVTLYITGPLPDKKEVWKLENRGGVEAYYWASDKVTCTIVSDLSETDIKTLGKKVFEQLTWRRDFPAKTS
jgi:anti-sigma factor RsiW